MSISPASSNAPSGFNGRLWHRFVAIAAPYWCSDERWRARGLLLLLVVLLLGQTAFNVWFNEESGEFTSALAARDADRFWASIQRYAVILLAAAPVYALYYYVRDTLSLRWRRWLTEHFMQRYFQQRAYYRLNTVAGLDNPDQRMAEDINAFTPLTEHLRCLRYPFPLWNVVFSAYFDQYKIKYILTECAGKNFSARSAFC